MEISILLYIAIIINHHYHRQTVTSGDQRLPEYDQT